LKNITVETFNLRRAWDLIFPSRGGGGALLEGRGRYPMGWTLPYLKSILLEKTFWGEGEIVGIGPGKGILCAHSKPGRPSQKGSYNDNHLYLVRRDKRKDMKTYLWLRGRLIHQPRRMKNWRTNIGSFVRGELSTFSLFTSPENGAAGGPPIDGEKTAR